MTPGPVHCTVPGLGSSFCSSRSVSTGSRRCRSWPDRRFFVKVADDRRVAHLHLLIAGEGRWQRQPAFRDALRADLSLVQADAELKAQLAREHPDDRETHTTGKESFVNDVLSGTAQDRPAATGRVPRALRCPRRSPSAHSLTPR